MKFNIDVVIPKYQEDCEYGSIGYKIQRLRTKLSQLNKAG